MAGYRLHRSHRLEAFLDGWSDRFGVEDPLADDVWVVVQNIGLGEWLKRERARRDGVILGMKTVMPEMALRSLADDFDENRDKKTILFLDGLKTVVLKAMEEAVASGNPVFGPLIDYAGDPLRENRLVPLADDVAGLFAHYGMNAPSLVASWERDSAFEGCRGNLSAHESWQRHLWRRLFGTASPYEPLGRRLQRIVESGTRYTGSARRLILFGSAFLGETGLRFIEHLSRDIEVDHFLLTPSRDHDGANVEILRTCGGLFRDFDRLLFSISGIETEEVPPEPEGEQSLLQSIQNLLVTGKSAPAPADASVRLHNVANRRREVEVLKERIMASFREEADLAPSDIGVLAPDISLYAPILETVFPLRDPITGQPLPGHLRYNLTDLDFGDESPYPAGFRALLDLPGSRFGRATILALAENPCFAAAAGFDAETVRKWRRVAESLYIRWGVDAEHRRSLGAAEGRTGSWSFAFERLLSGYAWDPEDVEDILPAPPGGETDVETIGQLMDIVEGLYADFYALEGHRRTLREWTLAIEDLTEKRLRPRPGNGDDEDDRRRVRRVFRDLSALSEEVHDLEEFTDSRLSYPTFRSYALESLRRIGGGRGRYLGEGVACASLKPLRAIPFRHLYVLGMDEGAWPGREILPGYDLRECVSPRAIDLSRESIDRYAFLETLLSARDRIAFFFVGRDPSTGDPRPPAVPVRELMDTLDQRVFESPGDAAKALTEIHPLAPFDPAVLTGEGPLSTTDPNALTLARVHREGPVPASSIRVGLPPRMIEEDEEEEEIPWTELLRFLKNPVAAFYRNRLRVPPAGREVDPEEHDLLETHAFDWWSWRDTVIAEDPESLLRGDSMVSDFRDTVVRSGAVAENLAFRLQLEEYREEIASMENRLRRILEKELPSTPPFTLRLRGDSTAVLPGVREIPAPRLVFPDGPPAVVVGDIPGLRVDGDGNYAALEFINTKTPTPRHQLSGWVRALCLGAAFGADVIGAFFLYRVGKSDIPLRCYRYAGTVVEPETRGRETIPLPDPEKALHNLVSLYRAGMREPIPLYPDIGEELAATTEEPDFLWKAADTWNRRIALRGDYWSLPRDCPYREKYLETPPNFEIPAFRDGIRWVYARYGVLP